MDIHSLSRKELQTLCKKNKIPANITNVAMADALKALQFVEGIEEFLNPSEPVTAQSSIESPEKSEVTSPCVLHTGGGTTRRKTVKDDVENSQTLTRSRRSTRKLVVGEVDEKPIRMVETPAAYNSRRAPVASVLCKMDTQLKEVEEDKKIGNKDISETPGVLPSSRRRGLMGENTIGRTYGTRRSARLAERNVGSTNIKEKGKLETVKSELFSEESGENLEILEVNVKESSDDLGEIIQTTDVDLKEELEEGLERNNDKEVNSDKKSDRLSESQIQLGSKFDKESSESFVVLRSELKTEDHGVEGDRYSEIISFTHCTKNAAADDLKTEVHSEICEETDPSTDTSDKTLEMQDEVQEKSGGGELYLYKDEDALENGDKLDANEEIVSENVAAETVEKEVVAQDNAFATDNKTLKMNEERVDLIEDGDSGTSEDLSVTDKVLENAKMENDMGFQDGLADNLEANKYSEDLAAFDISDGGLTKEDDVFTTDNKTLKMSEEIVDLIEEGASGSSDSLSVTDKVLDNAKKENDMGFQDSLADDLEANKYSEDLAAFDINDGGLTKEDGFYPSLASVVILQKVEQGMDLVSALESMTLDNNHFLEEEYVDNNLIEETTARELNASADVLYGFQPEKTAKSYDVVDSEKSPTKQLGILDAADGPISYNALPVPTADILGEVSVFNFTAEPSKILSSSAETELSHNVHPTCLTPSKKSASKTLMKKSASKKTPTTAKKLSHVFDDKENIDNSGTKLILNQEKENIDFGLPQNIDVSLRKLKKELREKLERSKNMKKDEQVMSSRPALQAVSEYIVGE